MANPRKPTSPDVRSNAVRIAFGLLLLTLALMPFVAMKRVEFEAHGFHPLSPQLETSAQLEQPAQPQGGDIIQQVSCQKYLHDLTIDDPNKGYEKKDQKRFTITDPPFWISLHNKVL